jgi:hypothetical protein
MNCGNLWLAGVVAYCTGQEWMVLPFFVASLIAAFHEGYTERKKELEK